MVVGTPFAHSKARGILQSGKLSAFKKAASMTAASRHGRLFFPGKLGLLFLVALVLLASLLFYMQTRHGFRHLIVPLAAKLTGARLEVRDGVLSLPGSLEVDGLIYDDPASGILLVRKGGATTPWSFLTVCPG
jgi:hypothetical protein